MNLPEAIAELKGGQRFGEVYPLLDDQVRDGPFLKAYFVHGDPLACGDHKSPPPPVITGDMCKCGGFMRQTGTCKECTMCGDKSGGCG